ncbi:MAG: hypothetical protein KA275_05905 [Chitinophagaceae bacterium]|nr:hypothetical protein [Chitinophagaceae bacterium]
MKKYFFLGFLLFALLSTAYVYWYYYDLKSEGSRIGVLNKISKKGNIFKTYEGEIVQLGYKPSAQGGINSNTFYFSVEDQGIADSLNAVLGKNLKVHYNQYRKCLPWRGENYNGQNQNNETGQYIVDKIEKVTDQTQATGF